VDRTPLLLVEDDDDIRDTLAEILTQEGYAVLGARDGREALDLAARMPPRLILLDLRMPVMDGVEFRQCQLRDPQLFDVPVIVLTAANDEIASDSVLQGCGRLRKPVDLDELLAAVAAACRATEVAAHP
jgi:DNA-binding response OmpR family regulator